MSDYFVHKLKVSLSLEAAKRIADEVVIAGRAANMLPLTVAVLDAGGSLVTFQRENGCGILRGDIAIGKAWGALGMGIASRTIRDRLADRPAFQSALAAASDGRFVPVPGGVLVMNAEHEVLGAVGVSGDTSDRDEHCAITAVRVSGFASHPAQSAPGWENSRL